MTTPHNPAATLTSSDGIPIRYRVHGPLTGLPVVALVHSLAMDHRFWDLQAARLDGKATVVAIDARGHGQSGHGPTPYTAQRMADDLREVLDHLHIDRVIVGGASMGGCVALQFAGSHPQRTRGLALIGTTAWYGPTAPKDWEDRANKGRTQGLASLVDFQKTRWFSDTFREAHPQVVDACIDTFLRNHIESYVATCTMLGHFDGRPLLPTIQVPTRILVGEEDYAAPVPMAQAMHAGIPHSRLSIIPNARHLAPLEVPDVVAATLLELCAEATR